MKLKLLFIGAAIMALEIVSLMAQSPISVTQTVTLAPKVDVFQNVSQVYVLTALPAAHADAMVFLNGLLMLRGADYTLTGNVLTFTGQKIGDAPIVQVMYWRTAQ